MQPKQPLTGGIVVLRTGNSGSREVQKQNDEPNFYPSQDYLAPHARMRALRDSEIIYAEPEVVV
jgi:NADPH-dependent glutamate synthase beta subunit-like oxidoreductase